MNDDIIAAMIREVIDNFDFDTVRKVMRYLDWRWGGESGMVPTCGRLVTCAQNLLRAAAAHAAECRYTVTEGTGGLSATAMWDDDLGVTLLKLAFEVTDWTAEREDIEE